MDATKPGLWHCTECDRVLGALTPAGRLWLAAEVVDLAQRYANYERVQCVCGTVNRFYWPGREPLDGAGNL